MTSVLDRLLAFCAALEARQASYRLLTVRPEAIMVALDVPGERWEIEFLSDGRIELERFTSQGVEARATAIEDALRYFASGESV